jgi:uncharacterized membrane protein
MLWLKRHGKVGGMLKTEYLIYVSFGSIREAFIIYCILR